MTAIAKSVLLVSGALSDETLARSPAPANITRIASMLAWSATLDAAIEHGVAFCLESDARVSAGVSAYIDAASQAYDEDERVVAFALSARRFRADGETPFVPIEDGQDVVFGRMALPVNFAVTAAQARRLMSDGARTELDVARRLTATDRYALYPRASLVISPNKTLSRQLDPNAREWRVGPLDDALAVYDERFEISASVLQRLNPALQAYPFDVDLGGDRDRGDAPYLLSARPCAAPLMAFALEMTPWETNVAFKVAGDMFSLAPREAFGPMTDERRTRLVRHLTRHTYIGGYLKQFVGRT